MQKNQRVSQLAQTAANLSSHTAFAPIADFMMAEPLFMSKGNKLPKIGIDLLGSDLPPKSLLESVLPMLDSMQHSAHFILFCDKENAPNVPICPYISLQESKEAISMSDSPLWAMRRKTDSSLSLGIQALQNRSIDAFISMGNTGALMALAKTRLKTLSPIARPALLALLPAKNSEIAVLDVGANTHCKSTHFEQFAAMGIAYQKSRGIAKPTVGLLNIGTEAIKGTPELRSTYLALEKLNKKLPYAAFQGNIEGRDVFEGKIDVLVTDGFTGNVFLKTAEGIAQFLLEQIQEYAETSHATAGKLKNKLDYSEYPGALLCGVNGIVIKCHGNAKPSSLRQSLVSAIHLFENRFLEKIQSELALFF